MRKRFEIQLALGITPIEKVVLPLKSRDELPPMLAGLQWIFQTPEINSQVFEVLETKLLAGKKATGRPGLDLWQILVLGVVRLGLDCDYDRLEHLANYDCLVRQILGLSPVRAPEEKCHCGAGGAGRGKRRASGWICQRLTGLGRACRPRWRGRWF